MNIWVWKVRNYEYRIANNDKSLKEAPKKIVNNRDPIIQLPPRWQMVISRRRFAGNGKEMYRNKEKKHVKGVQSFCFRSLVMQNL